MRIGTHQFTAQTAGLWTEGCQHQCLPVEQSPSTAQHKWEVAAFPPPPGTKLSQVTPCWLWAAICLCTGSLTGFDDLMCLYPEDRTRYSWFSLTTTDLLKTCLALLCSFPFHLAGLIQALVRWDGSGKLSHCEIATPLPLLLYICLINCSFCSWAVVLAQCTYGMHECLKGDEAPRDDSVPFIYLWKLSTWSLINCRHHLLSLTVDTVPLASAPLSWHWQQAGKAARTMLQRAGLISPDQESN